MLVVMSCDGSEDGGDSQVAGGGGGGEVAVELGVTMSMMVFNAGCQWR